jgi:hypothetical protein
MNLYKKISLNRKMFRCFVNSVVTNVHYFRETLRKAKTAANLDPPPILVSQWPARMLAPFPARRAYIQPGLELDVGLW